MASERTHNIVVRVSAEEQEMARRLAEAEDDPISRILRRYLRQRYVERFGELPKPRSAASRRRAHR